MLKEIMYISITVLAIVIMIFFDRKPDIETVSPRTGYECVTITNGIFYDVDCYKLDFRTGA